MTVKGMSYTVTEEADLSQASVRSTVVTLLRVVMESFVWHEGWWYLVGHSWYAVTAVDCLL